MENRIIAKKGFVTIATGAQKYYQMAFDLLKSYRLNGNSSLPFALICDRDCAEAQAFDHMVVISQPHYSYMDKLQLYEYSPFEETIFIDADALILSDTNILWDDFAPMDDFSCYGKSLPLESREGWFYYKDMKELEDQISFGVSLHGGLYYLRKTDRCKQIFHTAMVTVENFHRYVFTDFTEPADEPVLALAMALENCKPNECEGRIIFFPIHEGKVKVDRKGRVILNGDIIDPVVLHIGNWHTERYIYQFMRELLNERYAGTACTLSWKRRLKIRLRCLPLDTVRFVRRMALTYLPANLQRKIKEMISK